MSDIVERLREPTLGKWTYELDAERAEAATEIESLRIAITTVSLIHSKREGGPLRGDFDHCRECGREWPLFNYSPSYRGTRMTDIVERLHEPTETPNWDTKIVCTCGERCSHWMEFYRHRGDAYKAEIDTLREEVALWRATGIDPRLGIRPTDWKGKL